MLSRHQQVLLTGEDHLSCLSLGELLPLDLVVVPQVSDALPARRDRHLLRPWPPFPPRTCRNPA